MSSAILIRSIDLTQLLLCTDASNIVKDDVPDRRCSSPLGAGQSCKGGAGAPTTGILRVAALIVVPVE